MTTVEYATAKNNHCHLCLVYGDVRLHSNDLTGANMKTRSTKAGATLYGTGTIRQELTVPY